MTELTENENQLVESRKRKSEFNPDRDLMEIDPRYLKQPASGPKRRWLRAEKRDYEVILLEAPRTHALTWFQIGWRGSVITWCITGSHLRYAREEILVATGLRISGSTLLEETAAEADFARALLKHLDTHEEPVMRKLSAIIRDKLEPPEESSFH